MSDETDSNWGPYLGIGMEIAVGVGLGAVVGWWLDRHFGWTPWGIIAGTMIGLAGGMYLAIKEALRFNKQ